jgi:signal peptidase I
MGSFLWELLRLAGAAFVIMLLFRVFIAEPFIVSGSSMVPTYHNQEYLVVNKLGYNFKDPQRGDVIVFRYPKDPKEYFIKRVIGLPGETVRIEAGHVVISNAENPTGKKLDEPYLPNQNVTFGRTDSVTLGSDEYFVLGDNRLASSDSRVWGILPRSDIIGKTWLRVYPFKVFGTLEGPAPTLTVQP